MGFRQPRNSVLAFRIRQLREVLRFRESMREFGKRNHGLREDVFHQRIVAPRRPLVREINGYAFNEPPRNFADRFLRTLPEDDVDDFVADDLRQLKSR